MGHGLGFRHAMLIQRGHLFGWCPVGMACGIALFFGLRFEPSFGTFVAMGVAGLVVFFLARRAGEVLSPPMVFLVMIALGFVLAGWRAHSVAGPVLDWRYYGPVEGRIVGMDRSASDAVRLTLDHVKLDRVSPHETPTRVRISLHGDSALGVAPEPGLRVMTTAHLGPPGGPVEPGGFDFQRHAWFAELGAVGYTRVPLVAISMAEFDLRQTVFHIRMSVSAHVRQALPGDVGGFAAAVTTGDRSGISQDALNDLRASNTAHLLAISGLHMGLLSGFVFGVLRLLFAIIPYVALYWPARKMAAVGALIAASVYLALSGGNVATERAFVMVAVALCAVLVGRRAISLRAVAMAAIIVLTLRPEALMGPGFQMSFAATTALVAVFGWIRDLEWTLGPKWLQPVLGVVISSAVAGLATAPIGAAHFNTMAHYGLIANLASVPLMGALVIPAAVLALALAAVGLDLIGLWLMGLGLRWILWVADTVSGLDGAQGYVAGPSAVVLPLMAMGMLFVILWQGRARFAGLAAVGIALALWQGGARPQVLVADTGSLVGRMTEEGRALSRPKGAGFVARNWLENDGEGIDQETAARRWDTDGPGPRIVHLSGKRAAAAFTGCVKGDIVVANTDLQGAAELPCLVLTPPVLRRTGAIALVGQGDTLQLLTAREVAGDRMWSGWTKSALPDLSLDGTVVQTLAQNR
ncbi:ComEC/Rec2 family competence protein [uncultured Tateyamaria sp.]|uniref:ComEC/Rec2 family competence protein n=1 Tax=uncultured Tateyamaria sp. TaxID=455651 RepID=UPI0026352DE9|nr:ComEC/Rec2 family competence protein [uncultured Tateyamaria sp.]